MKRLTALLILTVLLLSGCMKSKPNAQRYRSSLSAAGLADAAGTALPGEFRTADADYLTDYVTLPQAGMTLCVRVATGGDCIDEYGVLHTDTDAEGAERLLREYLTRSYEQNRTFYDSYIPAETPKLRDAEVRRFGDYVVYAVLSPAERKTFFSAVKNALAQ